MTTQVLEQLQHHIAQYEDLKGTEQNAEAIAFFEKCLSKDLVFHRASGVVVTKEVFINAFKTAIQPDSITRKVQDIILETSEYTDKAVWVKLVVVVEDKVKQEISNIKNHRLFRYRNKRWQLEAWYNELIA